MKRNDTTKRLSIAALALLLVSTLAFGAVAQKRGPGGVIRLEETVIEGRVHKPNAFFINTRSDVVFEILEIKESFVDEIERVVSDGRF